MVVLEVIKGRAADLGSHILPSMMWQRRDKVYVNDGALVASSREDLLKMRGKRSENSTYDGFVFRILGTCSVAPRYIVIPGVAEEANEQAQLGGAMLVVGYDVKADRICISFSPTHHIKGKGGTKTPVHLSHQNFAQLREE